MKTQIIHLNKNDDYISIRDKMAWGQATRILLECPEENRILRNRLELSLLSRHANSLGVQIAILTQHSAVEDLLLQARIPVFHELQTALNAQWRTDSKVIKRGERRNLYPDFENFRMYVHPQSSLWVKNPVFRTFFFSISILALLAVGIVIIPSATIKVDPHIITQSRSLTINVNPKLIVVDPLTTTVPCSKKEIIVEGSRALNSTGMISIPDQVARGALQFTNPTDHPVIIPIGTIVSTTDPDPIRFMISSSNDIQIEPGQSVQLNAKAIRPGISGNLPPDSLTFIEGNIASEITITNLSPIIGGSDALVASPTQQDLASLRQELIDVLEDNALNKLRSSLSGGDILITPTLTMIEVVDESSYPSIGEPGNQVTLNLRLRYQAQSIKKGDLDSLSAPLLDSQINHGFIPVLNTSEYRLLSSPKIREDGTVQLNIQATRNLRAEISTDNLSNLTKGLTISQAAEVIKTAQPLVEAVQFKLTPKWWPRLPFLAMRIELVNP